MPVRSRSSNAARISVTAPSAPAARSATCTRGTASTPTDGDVKTFLEAVNETTKRLGVEQQRSGWVQQNFITDDTEAIAARANQVAIEAVARFAKEATKFDAVDVPADQRRQLNLLKLSLVMAAPSNAKESDELTKIAARLESTYGKGNWCPDPAKPDACAPSNTSCNAAGPPAISSRSINS